MLNILERRRIYSAIINSMKEEERYNKKKSVISAKNVLELSKARYMKMVKLLEPLKESLSNKIEITDIFFKDCNGESFDHAIVVEYKEDNIIKYFTIIQYGEDYFDIAYNLYDTHFEEMIDNHKKLINSIFSECDSYEEGLIIPSTSKMFIIREDITDFSLKDISNKALSLVYNNSNPKNSTDILIPNRIESCYSYIMDCLENDVNVKNMLDNIKVYEEDVPKHLLKKI